MWIRAWNSRIEVPPPIGRGVAVQAIAVFREAGGFGTSGEDAQEEHVLEEQESAVADPWQPSADATGSASFFSVQVVQCFGADQSPFG